MVGRFELLFVRAVVAAGGWGNCLRRSLICGVLNRGGLATDNYVRVRCGRAGPGVLLSARSTPEGGSRNARDVGPGPVPHLVAPPVVARSGVPILELSYW